ncbi:MAG: Ig-like domain-containing protein, partial [Anaerolineales bacterium]|nr:Ig-like domain-containing protein [Anaerolineales bacterium]
SREIAGRTAFRTWVFEGTLSEIGDRIEGVFTETITGFIARPVVSEGLFLVTRPMVTDLRPAQTQLLVSAPASMVRNGTADVQVLLRDSSGVPLPNISVTLATDRGELSTLSSVTDGEGKLDLTYTATNELGKVTLTVEADGRTQTRTIVITGNAPPQTVPDEALVAVGQSVVIDILANDSAIEGDLDPATVTIIQQPVKGMVTVSTITGAVTYQAAATSIGLDTFTYTVKDTNGVSSEVTTVTITIKDGSDSTLYLPLISVSP